MSEYDREEMEDSGEEGTNRLAWFLTGTIVGLTVAFLYAPKSGGDTRQYIAGKTRPAKDAVTETSAGIVDASKDMFDRGRRVVEDAADLFERARKLVRG